MKLNNCLLLFLIFAVISCNANDPLTDTNASDSETAVIECVIENQYTPTSRTYYEIYNTTKYYCAKWEKEDQVAMFFDGSEIARRFKLLNGENTSSAKFYGAAPDAYKKILAIYPYDIYMGQTSNSVDVCLPSVINYNVHKPLCGAMPMYAQGNAGALNFYNLMSVLKISVKGSGLLRSISISSIDGYNLSGKGLITTDENNIPKLAFHKEGNIIKINVGSVLLSTDATDFYLPIPATKYESGLKIDFEFDSKSETRVLNGPLDLERSVLRATAKPYKLSVPFIFINYKNKDNEIWYKSNYKVSPSDESESGLNIIADSYSTNEKLGVFATQTQIVKIGGPVFKNPGMVTFVKLPNTVTEIAMKSFKNVSIERFDAPSDLKILGTDAFLGCDKLKHIVLNEGLESLGLQVFGDCPNLESVYIPKTVQTIGAYCFRGSTSNLSHWDGDCALIDPDKHALYANSAYGIITQPEQIDIIAGCNLEEYKIPEQALYTQNYAFSGCKKLKKLIIHDKFRSFGLDLFSSLTNLESIVCYAENPPSFHSDENFASPALKEIKVPKNCIERYKKAEGWKRFSDKIVAL